MKRRAVVHPVLLARFRFNNSVGHWPSRIVVLLILAGLSLAGCSSHKSATTLSSPSAANTDKTLPPGPEAKIHISYSRPDDFLRSLVVSEYSAAEPIISVPTPQGSSAIVRFEGGVVVWEISPKRGLLRKMPLVGKVQSFAVKQVRYGSMPPGFMAIVPDSGPPEPLEPNHYYIFAVTRKSGSASYEAVKVNGDGTLEAYAAEPRAGTSFRLCCNIALDFVLSADSTQRELQAP